MFSVSPDQKFVALEVIVAVCPLALTKPLTKTLTNAITHTLTHTQRAHTSKLPLSPTRIISVRNEGQSWRKCIVRFRSCLGSAALQSNNGFSIGAKEASGRLSTSLSNVRQDRKSDNNGKG